MKEVLASPMILSGSLVFEHILLVYRPGEMGDQRREEIKQQRL